MAAALKITHLHRHMSVYQLCEAIRSLVAEATILDHQIGLASHMEEKDLHQWAEEREDAICAEVTAMIAELEGRPMADSSDVENRDLAISRAWHLCLGAIPGGARVVVQRPGGSKPRGSVAARDRLNEGVALLHTAWLAMAGTAVEHNTFNDLEALTDTVWQALTKFEDAKRGLDE